MRFRVYASGFRVQDLGVRVWGVGNCAASLRQLFSVETTLQRGLSSAKPRMCAEERESESGREADRETKGYEPLCAAQTVVAGEGYIAERAPMWAEVGSEMCEDEPT